MRLRPAILMLGAAAAFAVMPVSALTITDTITVNTTLAENSSLGSTFDITGSLAPGQTITSGYVEFVLQDDGKDPAEKFTVSFEGGAASPEQEIPGNAQPTIFSFPLATALLDQLMLTGTLSFTLSSVNVNPQVNDFIFVSADLFLTTGDPATPTPDGGASVLLLGLGLIGLAGVRRGLK